MYTHSSILYIYITIYTPAWIHSKNTHIHTYISPLNCVLHRWAPCMQSWLIHNNQGTRREFFLQSSQHDSSHRFYTAWVSTSLSLLGARHSIELDMIIFVRKTPQIGKKFKFMSASMHNYSKLLSLKAELRPRSAQTLQSKWKPQFPLIKHAQMVGVIPCQWCLSVITWGHIQGLVLKTISIPDVRISI